MAHKFILLTKTTSLAVSVHNLLKTLKPSGKFMKNQIERSVSSVVLNISEGNGRFGKDRKYHFTVALGSLKETESALNLLHQYGEIELSKELEKLIDECTAILWTLIHKR